MRLPPYTALDWLVWSAEQAAQAAVLVTALRLPRRDRPHAALFAWILVSDATQRMIEVLYLEGVAVPGVPPAGLARGLYHTVQALSTAWPALVAALAWWAFKLAPEVASNDDASSRDRGVFFPLRPAAISGVAVTGASSSGRLRCGSELLGKATAYARTIVYAIGKGARRAFAGLTSRRIAVPQNAKSTGDAVLLGGRCPGPLEGDQTRFDQSERGEGSLRTDGADVNPQKGNGAEVEARTPSIPAGEVPAPLSSAREESGLSVNREQLGPSRRVPTSPVARGRDWCTRILLTLSVAVNSQKTNGPQGLPYEPLVPADGVVGQSSSVFSGLRHGAAPNKRVPSLTERVGNLRILPLPVKAIFCLWLAFNVAMIATFPLPRGWTQPTLHVFASLCVALGAVAIVTGWARRRERAAQVAGYLVVVEGVVAIVGPWAGNVFASWRTVGAGMYGLAFSLLAAWQWWARRR